MVIPIATATVEYSQYASLHHHMFMRSYTNVETAALERAEYFRLGTDYLDARSVIRAASAGLDWRRIGGP